ncbi:MAG TPA: PHP domain-containing protein [Vicinamibacterales bacterium]|nr:PHP domain-containing protein [Vicinamibacterales bacterium]
MSPFHHTLAQLASLATIRGNVAEAEIWSRAIDLVRAHHIESEPDAGLFLQDPPPGLDPETLERLRRTYEAGGWVLLESGLADLPADLRWLFESGAVTLEQLATIHRELGVTSAADIVDAVREQKLRTLPGIDEAAESAVGDSLPNLRTRIPRIPLGRAVGLVVRLLASLRAAPGVAWVAPVGSLRRGQDMVGDIELIAATDQPSAAIDAVLGLPDSSHVLHRGERRLYVTTNHVQIGVRLPHPANAAADLLHLTGSRAHFEALQAHAASRGFSLHADGLRANDGTLVPASSESDIYGALGLPLIPPEIREGGEEIARAIRGELPVLVSRDDIRGDLHMHSEWSDGRDPIAAMVAACCALGYEYMAITDHSPTSAASRNLTIDSVKKQAAEIARLRERYPQIVILHGCETDILPDGRLDFPDEVLQQLDIVLASLHERAGHTPDQLMERYAAAMKHPLVTLITHPTNRLVATRSGYDLDYDRLFDMAAETGTVLEIDGAPSHLDLDGALARRAVAAGATVAIDSDCHRSDMLGRQMNLGILTARRGWVERRHVLNTRSFADVQAMIAAKRASR